MEIRFSTEDWARIRETYDKWWNKTLERPLISVIVNTPHEIHSSIPLLSQATCHRLDVSAEDVIERIHMDLVHQEYLGDAFPMVNFHTFGPGVVAAFLGAKLDNSSGSVWFQRTNELELKDMHFEYQKDNIWLNRIKDIYRAGEKKWHGNVLMGMPDLGGILDILASLRGSDNLLYDLYDEPEEVKRVSGEIQEAWLAYYRDLESVLQPVNPGYSDWSCIYSSIPSYVIQCDFSYMIGPDMFAEFAAPDLAALCRELPHTLYHLDGKGELPHLPQLCAIPELDAIQWVPGDGAPPAREWLDVYRQIRAGGKYMDIAGGLEDFRAIADAVGSEGMRIRYSVNADRKNDMIAFLKEFAVI